MLKKKIEEDEYTAKIVHDLKSPTMAQIAALNSFLSTASKKISQEEKDLIELTIHSCNYMQRLIEVFSLVRKLNFESLKLTYRKFDFVELINLTMDKLEILKKYYQLDITFEQKEPIIINADRTLMMKAIENLLSNSVNYAYKNTSIIIDLKVINEDLIFLIKNRSPYIDPKTLKEIFEKNRMNKNLYNKNGAGLSLYLSKEIVKAHFGTMIVESNQNDENVFGFKIPIG